MNKTPNFSRYEPELFPGLIFRMTQPKVVLLIFASITWFVILATDESDMICSHLKVISIFS